MTTIVQCLPEWLRSRFKKPARRKVTALCKKQRQVLPTLPNPKRSTPVCQEDKFESPGDDDCAPSSAEFIMSKREECDCIESNTNERAGEQVSPEQASDEASSNFARLNGSTSKFLAALYYWVISRR